MLSRSRMNAHSDEIEAMPGMRQYQRDEAAREHARDLEIERVYAETLEEHMSGDSETSYIMDTIDNHSSLYIRLLDGLVKLRKARTDHERLQAAREIDEVYCDAAEKHAELETEKVD